MDSITIRLFLPRGDANSWRIADIPNNWTGKALAAPRTELDEFLQRPELDQAGIYILSGTDPKTHLLLAYVGEAEIIRDRLKQHKSKDWWISAIVFVGNENLTKAHVRYLEDKLLREARQVGRYKLAQNQSGGAKLPEFDRQDMDKFLSRIRQLLPVLGSDLLTPVAQPLEKHQVPGILFCRSKGAEGRGHYTPDGFVVLKGSTAVLKEWAGAKDWPSRLAGRDKLIADGVLVEKNGFYEFTKDVHFRKPSGAAAVIQACSVNGLKAWKTKDGKNLKEQSQSVRSTQSS